MGSTQNVELLRQLPQVEEVLRDAQLSNVQGVPRENVVNAVRAEIDARRQLILAGGEPDVSIADVARAARERAQALTQVSLRRVVNASGVIVHTNLGRSVLAAEAIAAVNEVIAGYSTLE